MASEAAESGPPETSFMSARYLLDTNVLVYAEDADEPAKCGRARDLIADLVLRDAGVVSSQVLAEFFVTVTRRFAKRLDGAEASKRLEQLADLLPVLDVNADVVREAARGVARYRMSFWDAQIWASARLAGVGTVLTEDLPGAGEIEGVRFADPFAEGFSLEG